MFDWKFAKKPIVALSPMADMTDSPFCLMVRRFGSEPVFREMVSAEALVRGNLKTLEMTAFDQAERPLVQQIFGSVPATMADAAKIVEEKSRPDGLDLNMGCPVYKLVSDFNGAALMKDPPLASAIVKAVRKAVALPLSVKIRLGWSDPHECLEFVKVLEEAGADLITVHGRTKVQGYGGEADWAAVGEAKKRTRLPVLVNGDVFSPEAAARALEISGCDGVMVARGALGNPWILRQISEFLATGRVSAIVNDDLRRRTVLDHARLMLARYGERGIVLMRKHFAWYFKGLPGGKDARARLMRAETLADVEDILSSYKPQGASLKP